MSDALRRRPCPVCLHPSLDIDMRMSIGNPTSVSLAGEQMKFPARWVPILYCWRPECDFVLAGWIEGRHAVFPIAEEGEDSGGTDTPGVDPDRS